ncbi:hypothetical protein E4H12_12335 [Candidatus Thorarchaeota archaeon]|nr:MAG: hypothetical protein E4H12_12335 [Candidatus Thorarchaeota archaeon]
MNMKYQWKDVWLLSSIIMAGESDADAFPTYKKKITLPQELAQYKNIYGVIGAGDYIDHSIFTIEELITGTKNLLDGEFIEVENDYLKPTKKTREYLEKEIGDRKHISIKTALSIFEKLLEINFE